MHNKKSALEKVNNGELLIYHAVAVHELRKAKRILSETTYELKDLSLSSKDIDSYKVLVSRQVKSKAKCEKFSKRIEAINLLLEYKNDILRSSSYVSHNYSCFMDYFTSKEMEEENLRQRLTSELEKEKLGELLILDSPDISDIKSVLKDAGLEDKEIDSLIGDANTYQRSSQWKPIEDGDITEVKQDESRIPANKKVHKYEEY